MAESCLKSKELSFLAVLGKGSFGQVLKVQSSVGGSISAVKCISIGKYRRRVSHNEIIKILREVNVIQILNNNVHVVKIIDSWIDGPMKQYFDDMFGCPNAPQDETENIGPGSSGIGISDAEKKTFLLIQMEYCETDLQNWMKVNNTRTIETVLKLSCQMLNGLAYIHKNNVVHRDLKPANILIKLDSRDICCKIGDFGLARFKPQNDHDLYTTRIGTYLYMSPEMQSGKQVDYKTDVFSMGLILLELIYCPVSKQFLNDLYYIQHGKFPTYFNNQENADFYRIVRKMLSQNTTDRPAAAACLAKMMTLVIKNQSPLEEEFQQPPDNMSIPNRSSNSTESSSSGLHTQSENSSNEETPSESHSEDQSLQQYLPSVYNESEVEWTNELEKQLIQNEANPNGTIFDRVDERIKQLLKLELEENIQHCTNDADSNSNEIFTQSSCPSYLLMDAPIQQNNANSNHSLTTVTEASAEPNLAAKPKSNVQSVYEGNLGAQFQNQTYSEQQLNQLLSTNNLIALEECGKRNAEFYEEAIPNLQSALSNLDVNYSKTNSAKLKLAEETARRVITNLVSEYEMEIISKRESVMQSIENKIQNLKDFVVAELSTMALPQVNFKLMKKEYIQKCKEDLREEYNLLPDEMLVNYVEPKLETALTGAYNIWISKEPSSLEIDLAIIHAKMSYNNLMEQQTAADKHEHPSILKSKHLAVCKQVTTEFEKAVKQTPTVIMKLNEVLNEAFRRYEDKNKLRAADLLDAAIGIDLGTTYSCVSFYKNGRTEMIPDRNNHRNVTPSYIQFISKDEVIVGETAKDQAIQHPENTIFDAKRLIGRWFDDESVQKDLKFWPFKVINCNNRPKIEVHGKAYLPETISAKLLTKLKSDAESHLQCDIKNAVITVPAYFSEAQKRATKLAGKTAGLNVLEILNEPTAAAIAYSLKYADEKQRNLFVYDLGGGTFDVSILVVKGGKIEVKGVDGDTHLGGEDFDTEMLKYCISEFERENNITLDTSNEVIKNSRLQRIRHACEKQKQYLSVAHSVYVTLERMHQDLNMHVEITRDTFNRINAHHFNKTIQIVDRSLIEAGISKSEVNDIVLVGGSTLIPKVQELLKQFFDGKSLNIALHPDEVVASGAAIYAALLTGSKAHGLGHIVFSDVTPLSLGIQVKGGGFSPIIRRNSKVPLSKTKTYYTTCPNQTSVQIVVYEGEDPIAKKNNLLGTFNLNGVPPGPSGREKIEVTIACDEEGLLTVTAVCKSNGINHEITIEADRHGVSETGAQ